MTWTLTLAPEPADGAATVNTPQEAQRALLEALSAHLAGVDDEATRRELATDYTAPLGRWAVDAWPTIQRGRGITYNAPGAVLVRMSPVS
ncbi:hypothetical protein [Streptomyces sp. CC224B]|uniref:hypothetical protein n=1 Tax=Streptomyces sp. CC224B TaxID=3044571 RepID=UPI0024A9348B|nr:hypothetical protein [Streptomyces sp. CC224B]